MAAAAKPRSLTVPRTCQRCGAEFLSCASHINAGKGKFCGRECGNAARRRSLSQSVIVDNSIPEPNSGCWLWTLGTTGSGYGAIRVDGRQRLAHRLSFMLSNGGISGAQPVVRHRCDNRLCVNPDHLEAGTAGDNVRDSSERGTISRGEHRPAAKLKEADIPRIRSRKESIRVLAETFGVSERAIMLAQQRKTWRHVE